MCCCYLVHVEFNIDKRHSLVSSAVMFQNTVQALGYILHNQVEEQLVFTSGGEEAMLQTNHIRMVHNTHQLKLSVLVPPVLQNLLYRHGFSGLETLRLENYPEGACSDDTLRHVTYRLFWFSVFASDSCGDYVASDLIVSVNYSTRHLL